MSLKKVAVIILNYQDYAKKYLDDFINSLNTQSYLGEVKLFITDNASTSESVQYLNKIAPNTELILNKNNDGFSKGNNDAIKLALAQGSDYIFCVNMDTIMHADCISKLIENFENYNEKVAIVQARLMLHPETNKINSVGNDIHFLGFGYCRGYNRDFLGYQKKHIIKKEISYPSGAAVMFKREFLEEFGMFDEEFWMYNEDQDIGLRAWYNDYQCVLASDAVVYHKYEFSRSIQKYYWMDRNRIIVILKYYKIVTLLLIFPAFVLMEFGLILFSLKNGWFKEKLKVWQYFCNPQKWIYLYKARLSVQKNRKISDYNVMKMFSGKIFYQEIEDWLLKTIAQPI
jgi:GT2 family glycosyltransferase